MNDIIKNENLQLILDTNNEFLMIPSFLNGFKNTNTIINKRVEDEKTVYCFEGTLLENKEDRICPNCGSIMHIHNSKDTLLKHLPFGDKMTLVLFKKHQFYCENCHHSEMQNIPFKASKHRITQELYNYVITLLSKGVYTLKEVSYLTGVNKDVVKEIDLDRLKELYTDNGEKLKIPKQANFLGIDEFKLHDGYKYATHIINLETGEVLFVAKGKKKQVVYDFMELVGSDWMKNVIAVACDMNSDFEEAFKDKCPHIKIVFDHFHIVKNFNEKVVSEVRKDEQKRLKEEGNEEAAKALKGSRYILTSNRSTLQRKDKEAKEGKVIQKESTLFKEEQVTRKYGYENKLDELIQNNTLLFTADLIKEKLRYAYTLSNEEQMRKEIQEIIDLCKDTENKHFLWFSRLLENHIDGIITHATYKISSGKIEGINNKIKTLRRQGYGYPDDEYFFLKIIDISR